MKRIAFLVVACLAIGISGQAKVTESQILGKWKGKYKVDISKAPPDRAKMAAEFKKNIEAAVFSIDLRKDHTTTVVTSGGSPNTNGTLEATWKMIGSDLEIKATKFNKQPIKGERAMTVNFRIMKADKVGMTWMMINRNAPPTTLTLKKG